MTRTSKVLTSMTRTCKVNHAFTPTANCAYTYLHSPRFGPVVAVTTVRQVVFDFYGLAFELLALLLILKIILMKALAITVIQVVFGFYQTRVRSLPGHVTH